jgi:hypothetical protein
LDKCDAIIRRACCDHTAIRAIGRGKQDLSFQGRYMDALNPRAIKYFSRRITAYVIDKALAIRSPDPNIC